ncbi:MAG: glutamate-5-semialdehyde dehydrogenase [Desulfobulbus propionicus]|nr:MAG: glutamate-5-semialdehyde dehydrogenase [Desulfobulbus propionicus]
MEQVMRIGEMTAAAKAASRELAAVTTAQKNATLVEIAQRLEHQRQAIIEANALDLAAAKGKGLSPAMLNRLQLDDAAIKAMIEGLNEVVALADPVGEIEEMCRRPSGILVGRMRVPLGVILMIYESRPTVTIDAAALCLKAGNAVILRGGSEAFHSNQLLSGIMQQAFISQGLPEPAVQVVPFTDRACIEELLVLEEYIDLVIPRGGEGLIRMVSEKSRIPVLKHYKGVCHMFVDATADVQMAVAIALNGKTQRPGVCNALEGILVHRDAAAMVPVLAEALHRAGVQVLGCAASCQLATTIQRASDEDWGQEFLDLKLVLRVVDSMAEAMAYIARYGSQHTEIMVTDSHARAQRFLREVDASAVMINASSRFNDGGQFGLGAEIGISTTKLHAYGPMGLRELTTRKFIVYGDGHIRE